eukprot:4898199-Amphidinium_carterae.1
MKDSSCVTKSNHQESHSQDPFQSGSPTSYPRSQSAVTRHTHTHTRGKRTYATQNEPNLANLEVGRISGGDARGY